MAHIKGSALDFSFTILDESGGLFDLTAIAEIDVGPNAFDVSVGNCFVDVWVRGLVIHRDEGVAILAQPESENSISHLHIRVGIVSCKS